MRSNYHIQPALPSKVLQLNRPQNKVRRGRKGKSQLKSNITTVGQSTRMLSDGTHPPNLGHTSYHACYAEAESRHGRNAWRQLVGVVVVLGGVSVHATPKYEVIHKRDALVDSEPIADEIHEVFQHGLEVTVSGDGDCNIDTGSNSSPDEARDASGPVCKDLHGECNGVDVRAVVRNDCEGEDDEAKFAETA